MAVEDVEGPERPVREQLKKASIGGMTEEARSAAAAAKTEGLDSDNAQQKQTTAATTGGVGSSEQKDANKKAGGQEPEEPINNKRHHTRKRSRDSTAEVDELEEHKRKISGERSRAQSPVVAPSTANGSTKSKAGDRSSTPEPAARNKTESADEAVVSPKVKRSKIQGDTATTEADQAASSETTKIPPGSAFSNTSAASPFGALAKKSPPPSEQPQTSASAFAASGFGALAGSSTSGFGAVSKSNGGFGSGSGGFGFGSKSPLGASTNDESSKSTGSSFGGALGQQSPFAAPASSSSGFGSGASGFGKIGQSSGFGGSGGGLTSFASGKSTPLSGAIKQAKAFGAPPDDDEEGENEGGDDDDGNGSKSPLVVEEDQKDERFFEQEVETGEENEVTKYSCRAKLYNYSTLPDGKKEWRERGLGVLRLNVKASGDGDNDGKPKARFLMRADGSHRVVLNTPIKKEITFGTPSGAAPTNGFIYFMGTFDGRENLEMLQLKVRSGSQILTSYAIKLTPHIGPATVCSRALRQHHHFAKGHVDVLVMLPKRSKGRFEGQIVVSQANTLHIGFLLLHWVPHQCEWRTAVVAGFKIRIYPFPIQLSLNCLPSTCS